MTALPPVNTLRSLLFGDALSTRGGNAIESVSEKLDDEIREIIGLLRAEHTDQSRAFKQAERELSEVKEMSNSDASVACKRGILLFAIWRDPDFAERFRASDSALVDDLTKRVLPVAAPSFLANLGQRPDAFVALVATLSILWSGEPMTLTPNWDHLTTSACLT